MDTIGLDQFVSVGVVTIYALLTLFAELLHAYRSRSARVLANRYTFGCALSLLTFLLRLTVIRIRPGMPLWQIVFYLGIVDYCALYLFAAHFFVRGTHFIAILLGRRDFYEANWPMPKRLEMCSLAAWGLAVIVLIRAGSFVVVWLIDLFAHW